MIFVLELIQSRLNLYRVNEVEVVVMRKENIKRNRRRLFGIWLLLLGLLAGCGKKEISNLENDGSNTISDSQENAALLKNVLGVTEDKIQHKDEVDNFVWNVNAEISVPDADKVGIYNLETLDTDPDTLTAIAEKVFDNGEYDIIWPYYTMTDEEREDIYIPIQEELSQYENDDQNTGASQTTDDTNISDIGFSYFKFEDLISYAIYHDEDGNREDEHDVAYEVADKGDKLCIYPSNEEGEGYVTAEGYIDGKLSRLTFNNYYNEVSVKIVQDHDYCLQYSVVTNLSSSTKIGCSYTEDEAKEIAEEYMDSLGLYEYSVTDTAYLRTLADSTENNVVSGYNMVGYIFCFGLTIDNVPVINQYAPFSGISVGQLDNGYVFNDGTDKACKVYVSVTSEGVIECQTESAYTYSKDTDDVTLLTFNQIDEAARSIVVNKYADASSNYKSEYDIYNIQFGYTFAYENDKNLLMPVWCYSSNAGIGDEYPVININAISGEEVTEEVTE
jgi:hypothetical protein